MQATTFAREFVRAIKASKLSFVHNKVFGAPKSSPAKTLFHHARFRQHGLIPSIPV